MSFDHGLIVAGPRNIPVRRRIFFGLLAPVIMALGLAARSHASKLPSFLALYAPDALWALLVFAVAAVTFAKFRTLHVAAIALGFAYLDEFSQLYQAPWINAVRATKIGSLVLGHGFLWSDLACYTAGVACGALIHMMLSMLWRHPKNRRQVKRDA